MIIFFIWGFLVLFLLIVLTDRQAIAKTWKQHKKIGSAILLLLAFFLGAGVGVFYEKKNKEETRNLTEINKTINQTLKVVNEMMTVTDKHPVYWTEQIKAISELLKGLKSLKCNEK